MNFIRQLTQKSSSYYFKQFRGRGISRKHFRSFSSTLDQKDARNNTWTAGAILFTLTSSGFFLQHEPSPLLIPCTSLEESHSIDKDSNITLLNWSGTHQVDVSSQHYYEPTSEEEVISILSMCHENNWSVRPVGSALSPNGLSFQHQGMMSLSHLDSVLEIQQVSPESATVRVQAGAKVSHLLDTLRSHGWTLPNLASISEQQLGGFVQVSAHGTGATIPPVDDFVVAMTLITPSKGKIHLSLENNGDLFHLAKVGLGCLGIVTELTLKCIPAHKLVEHTFVLTREEAKAQIRSLLQQHKHVRYMWIPYEDAVVVVTNDPEETLDQRKPEIQVDTKKVDVEERFQPFTDLIRQLKPVSVDEDPVLSNQGFGDLRDQLIAHDPLNETHIRRVNKAEAEFWRRSEGYQIKPSDQLLQFDCGGQVGSLDKTYTCTLIPYPSKISFYWSCHSNGSMKSAFQLGLSKKMMDGIWASWMPC
jgi:L-galactono-1,4-lactone dehydrogenase